MADPTFEKFREDHRKRLDSLYEGSGAGGWSVSFDDFSRAVWEGIRSAASAEPKQVPELLKKTHAQDLALVLACAKGNERAWEAFSYGYRTWIYDAACAIASDLATAREISSSIAGDLYGTEVQGASRRSRLFYFHGRSSLKTWLRAVVYQRYVDEYRRQSRLAPLPEDQEIPAPADKAVSPREDQRYWQLLGEAVAVILRELAASDRLLLSFYYVQQLTLKQIGRITRQHEATVSRHLEEIRQRMRKQIETYLRKVKGLKAYEVDRCLDFASRGVSLDLEKELKTE